jgi:urease accessory protein UreF
MRNPRREILICTLEQFTALTNKATQHCIHETRRATEPECSSSINGKVHAHLRSRAGVLDLMSGRHEQRAKQRRNIFGGTIYDR